MERTIIRANKGIAKFFNDTKNSIIFSVEKFAVPIKNLAFDKAMDANYILSHIGGRNHRLFDGSHDIIGAWKVCGEVTNSNKEHIIGWLSGLWNDMITPKGLPFITLSPERYEKLCSMLKTVPREKVYDLLSYTPIELLGTATAIASVITKCKIENIYTHSSIATLLTAIAIKCSSIPAGLLATVQIIKVVKVCINKPSAIKQATEGLIVTVVTIALSMTNPILGISFAVGYNVTKIPKVKTFLNKLIYNITKPFRKNKYYQ